MASNKTTMGGNISEPFDGHHKARDRFFGTAELLLELAEAVDYRDDLKNLCLVNKAFDGAFSRKLYRQLSFTVNASLPQRLETLLQTTKVEAIRDLSFRQDMNGGEADHFDSSKLLLIVGQLLKKTPALREFGWTHQSKVDILRLINDVVNPNEYSLSKFRYLLISPTHLPSPDDFPLAHELRMPWNLTTLKTLVLAKFECSRPLVDFGKWFSDRVDGMVSVLISSPKLEYLELSVAKSFLRNNRQFVNFFPRICERYHERGCSPLQLTGLNLGFGMMLVSEHQKGEAAYLRHLTRLQNLVYLHIPLEGIEYFALLAGEGEALMHIAWGTMSEQNTPSLEYLHMDELDQAGYEYLLSDGVSSLLQNVELQIDSELVYTDDAPWGQPNIPELIFARVADLFSDRLERPLQTRSLRIKVDPSVFKKKAPKSWLNLEILGLTSSIPTKGVFAGISGRFLSLDASIQVLSLQFLVPIRKPRNLRRFRENYIDILENWVSSVAQTCKQLQEVVLTFYLLGSRRQPSGEETYCWRVVRKTMAPQSVGEGWHEEEVDDFEIVRVYEF